MPLARELVVLAQGMPFPVIGKEDPPEIGMALEHDPEEIVGLPLVPVGCRARPPTTLGSRAAPGSRGRSALMQKRWRWRMECTW